ncbi:MAG: 3-phosphoserine/phosphohydroxythreonine transaminase [Sphingomonadales bacterium]|nr:3-phosphoserine/phosphohydroxythreonine transaminase [Sphingomonadales bacterium]
MNTVLHNFSAGPGILPQSVVEASARDLVNFSGTGLSVIEVSHRGKEFVAVMEEARTRVRGLLQLGDDYEVLFLHGGASLQFCMVPYNLLPEQGMAAYLNTGVWASKAIQDARLLGRVEVVGSSEDRNFCYIPRGYSIPSDASYLHITSNNTIFGTEMHQFPDSPVPIACDMSSDIFSRPIDASRFGLIYAGAQKNMGPAGTTLVVVKREHIGKSGRRLPAMLDYAVHSKGDSMHNTPPVFAVLVCMHTLHWIEEQGGLTVMEQRNRTKASLLYSEIDRNPLFRGTADTADRSLMNATFVLSDEQHKAAFDALLREARISGLEGHRSVGGYRASMYNALPRSSVQVLVDVMQELERNNG